MSKPKIIGPTGATKYLGHFAQEKHLRAGHNTDGQMEMKRLKSTAHLPRRSDTPGFDDLTYDQVLSTAKAQLSEKTMKRRSVEPGDRPANEEMARDKKRAITRKHPKDM